MALIIAGRVGVGIACLLEETLRPARGPVGMRLGDICIDEPDVICLDDRADGGEGPYSLLVWISLLLLCGGCCSTNELGLAIDFVSGLFEKCEGAVYDVAVCET